MRYTEAEDREALGALLFYGRTTHWTGPTRSSIEDESTLLYLSPVMYWFWDHKWKVKKALIDSKLDIKLSYDKLPGLMSTTMSNLPGNLIHVFGCWTSGRILSWSWGSPRFQYPVGWCEGDCSYEFTGIDAPIMPNRDTCYHGSIIRRWSNHMRDGWW